MKSYVHKHFAFDSEFWEYVSQYFEIHNIKKGEQTQFVKSAILLKIHQT